MSSSSAEEFKRAQVTKDLYEIDRFVICAPPNTNCAVSYLIRKSCCDKLMKGMSSFDLPIDFELACQFSNLGVTVAHIDPYIVKEGSKFKYKSEVEQFRTVLGGAGVFGKVSRLLKRLIR